jgi:uncharacterized membrane protein YfcA
VHQGCKIEAGLPSLPRLPLAAASGHTAGVSRSLATWFVLVAGTLACAAFGPIWHAPGIGIMAAVALASVVSSIAGFAFSAVAGALLFHLMPDPVLAVQIMMVCSIANQAAMTWSLRSDVQGRSLGVFLIGGLLGLPLGVWLLLHANHAAYVRALGAFLLAYGIWMLLRRPVTLRQSPVLDFAIGWLGGVTGGAAAFPGAPVTIWCGFKGWDKTRQRALFQPFILLMQLAAVVAIGMAKPHAGPVPVFDLAELFCIPGSLLGTRVGLLLFRWISDRQFAMAVNALLIVSGISYLL